MQTRSGSSAVSALAAAFGLPAPINETGDALSIYKATMKTLRAEIKAALPAISDRPTCYHLEDMVDRLTKVARCEISGSPGLQCTAATRATGGTPVYYLDSCSFSIVATTLSMGRVTPSAEKFSRAHIPEGLCFTTFFVKWPSALHRTRLPYRGWAL